VTQTRRFFVSDWEEQSPSNQRLCLVGGGCEWCAPDFTIDRCRFPYVAIEMVWRGKGRVRLSGQSFEVGPGHAYIFDSTTDHRIQSDSSEPMVKFFFNFAGPRIRSVLRDLELNAGECFRLGHPERVTALFEETLDHALKGTRLGLTAAAAAVEHAIVLFAEQRHAPASRHDPAHGTYLRCRDHLLRHYPSLTSVEQAASELGLSAPYITRLFRRYGHETPLQTLTRLRMNEALLKLREPGTQVKGVAHELGFKSPAHFSRAFKQWHGRAPSEMMG
jgi:AraC-like DNA-binding protein